MILLSRITSFNKAWQTVKARGSRWLDKRIGPKGSWHRPKIAVETGTGSAGVQIMQMEGISDGAGAAGKNIKILFVDDEISLHKMTGALLNNLGHEDVHFASSGAEALTKLKSDMFDLVFVDLTMPGMGGIQLIREIDKDWPQMNVVVVSGLIDQTVVNQLKALNHQGRIALLAKPFMLRDLRSVIEALYTG